MKYIPTFTTILIAVALGYFAPQFLFGYCWLVAHLIYKHR